MSMCGTLIRISQVKYKEILADPDKFWNERGENCIDIDKAWHGIHYLLTGIAWGGDPPASWVIFGAGNASHLPDTGYGPVRFLHAKQVRKVAKFLGAISRDDLYKKYKPQILDKKRIYPSIQRHEPER